MSLAREFVGVEFCRLHPAAVLPRYSYEGDAGLDLASIEAVELDPGDRRATRTGWSVALAQGTVGLVVPRSGIAHKHAVTVLNAPGIVDASYRGEIKVILVNIGTERVELPSGTRIAQLVVVPMVTVDAREVPSLDPTERGSEGIGSTGM